MTSLPPPNPSGPEIIEFEMVLDDDDRRNNNSNANKSSETLHTVVEMKSIINKATETMTPVDVAQTSANVVPPPPPRCDAGTRTEPPTGVKLQRPTAFCVGLILVIALVLGVVALALPEWRRGYFPRPHNDDAIRLGLFYVSAPYSEQRGGGSGPGYGDGWYRVCDPESDFESWRRVLSVPNVTFASPRLGVDYDADNMDDVCTRSIVTATLLCCAIVGNVVTVGMLSLGLRRNASVGIVSVVLLLTALLYVATSMYYLLAIRFGIEYEEDRNPILSKDSIFGASVYLVIFAAIITTLTMFMLHNMLSPVMTECDNGGDTDDEDSDDDDDGDDTANRVAPPLPRSASPRQ
eukprot:PhM_4_TR6505/c0_g1_i1/m.58174